MPFADRLLRFLTEFPLPPSPLPNAVQAESPYREPAAAALLTQFAQKYYADDQPRVAVLGINPGRLGGGRTGIAFTDPGALTEFCGIAHALPRQAPELSSTFVYQVVTELGGPASFYQHFYLGSVYPLTLLRNGLNYNYYDAPALTAALWPDMQLSLRQQVRELGVRAGVVVCLGKRNGLFLQKLNGELELFGRVVVLDHPRFLMQYRRKDLAANVSRYVAALAEAAGL
ncbi:uracil-DNA glycosylase family protein [uncultured Hymenobacter sp.]|uniref:uracil-DNA glycosylase family protein n=1 Tax=uncultured Hymenobacter sp. TaxID=170016 RepID=UPI0035CC2310